MISIRRVSLGGGYRYLMQLGGGRRRSTPTAGGPAAYYAASGTPPGASSAPASPTSTAGEASRRGARSPRSTSTGCSSSWPTRSAASRSAGPRRHRRGGVPVAGFDLTFSPCKSVCVAWALADEATKAVIYDCHHRAVETVLSWARGNVFRSRSGKNGVVEEDVTGVVATAFTHLASRADDPQLHDHVVVWNRARSVSDGRWRTLDSGRSSRP